MKNEPLGNTFIFSLEEEESIYSYYLEDESEIIVNDSENSIFPAQGIDWKLGEIDAISSKGVKG